MTKEILVTILLATYNGEKYLPQQLESIIGQTHHNWRIIVSDDGSTDGTVDIIKEYQNKYPKKIILLDKHESHGGACGNFLFLLQQAVRLESDYIMFCDQDDVWLKHKVALTLSQMIKAQEAAHSEPVLVFTDLLVADADLNIISNSFMRYSKLSGQRTHLRHLLIQNVVTGCTVMINKPLAKLALQFNNTEYIIMHDWWLALVCAAFGTIEYLDAPTVKYRQHAKNEVGAKKVMSLQYLTNKIFVDNNIKSSMNQSMLQAKEFYSAYHTKMQPHQSRIAAVYLALKEHNKLRRMAFVVKYRLWKYGILRKIAQLIWI